MYSNSTKSKLRLSELEVMYGVFHCYNNSLALNHLIILGKYFLYVNALNTTICQFVDFVSLVRDKIKLEKYIAVTSNREKEFKNKWNLCTIVAFFFFFKAYSLLLFVAVCRK